MNYEFFNPAGLRSSDVVSIHAPAKGRPALYARYSSDQQFRSTPPRRGDVGGLHLVQAAPDVSIHAPAKGRPRPNGALVVRRGVSIHAPAKGRPWRRSDRPAPSPVSIHAPAKGRRARIQTILSEGGVSIHAPAKGRRSPSRRTPIRRCFDPRPREGATLQGGGILRRHSVSIHAPAKGRLGRGSAFRNSIGVSIHAPAKGRLEEKFAVVRGGKCFDPRPREGATTVTRNGGTSLKVSIHAPAKGRHLRCRRLQRRPAVSIHAPAKGRRSIGKPPWRCLSFDPRPREGATLDRAVKLHAVLVSIHAPAKGRHDRLFVVVPL